MRPKRKRYQKHSHTQEQQHQFQIQPHYNEVQRCMQLPTQPKTKSKIQYHMLVIRLNQSQMIK